MYHEVGRDAKKRDFTIPSIIEYAHDKNFKAIELEQDEYPKYVGKDGHFHVIKEHKTSTYTGRDTDDYSSFYSSGARCICGWDMYFKGGSMGMAEDACKRHTKEMKEVKHGLSS